MDESLLKYFPNNIRLEIKKNIINRFDIEEIRIRNSRPIILKAKDEDIIINNIVTTKDLIEILQLICENSIYTYQNQIAEGYITVKGGHRVGICGSCVLENGKVKNINYLYGMNFRIAREILGCSNEIINDIINYKENLVYNTLIVGKPGSGKTTLLRDIIRNLSTEENNFKALNVGVVDERGEIAALYKGQAQNDLGLKVDIMENVSKSIGIKMLVRSMAPQVIVADEIGKEEDIDAINYAICSGCKGIFTAHGSSMNDLKNNIILKRLMECKIIEKVIVLNRK